MIVAKPFLLLDENENTITFFLEKSQPKKKKCVPNFGISGAFTSNPTNAKRHATKSDKEAKALITPRLFRAIGINAVRAAARLVRDNLGQSHLGDAEGGEENLTNSHFSTRTHREEYFRHLLQHTQQISLRWRVDETAQ